MSGISVTAENTSEQNEPVTSRYTTQSQGAGTQVGLQLLGDQSACAAGASGRPFEQPPIFEGFRKTSQKDLECHEH